MWYQHIENKEFRLRFTTFGTGPVLMLAFHGFNRSPDDFRSFGKQLGSIYTIVAFDLFFHGDSWLDERTGKPVFTKEQLAAVVETICSNHGVSEFEVMAYSFGGRIALKCVELFPGRVKGCYLMAPDGLRYNPFYSFAANTIPGRAIFRWFSRNPAPILWVFEKLLKTELINPKALEFYYHHLSVAHLRKKVYNVWVGYRKVVPDLDRLANIFIKHPVPLLLFFGRYDVIIPATIGEKFSKRINRPESLKVLDIGHRVMEKNHEICREILSLKKIL